MLEKFRVEFPPPMGKRSYDADAFSAHLAFDTGEERFTQQHFADEVDINNIVRRYGLDVAMQPGLEGGVFGDFTGITDYASAVERVSAAQSDFMRLPAEVRERFSNDPGTFLKFAEENPDAFLKMAELAPPPPPAPAGPVPPAPVSSPPTT